MTGGDEEVIEYLQTENEVSEFVDSALKIIYAAALNYRSRGFRDLSVAFGCTGGRHRSVYCANETAKILSMQGFKVRTIHWQLEQDENEYSVRHVMILAAGEGKRLAPITGSVPKALVKAGGSSMLKWTIEAMNGAEFTDLTVNVCHLAEKISEYLLKSSITDEISEINLSREIELLGTGGGIFEASRFLHNPKPVLVHNVDIWSDFDLRELYDSHKVEDLATLACQKRESSRYLLVDEDMKVCGRQIDGVDEMVADPAGKIEKYGFSGIHVFSPGLWSTNPGQRSFSIIDHYLRMIERGSTVSVIRMEGNWFDMGTPEKLKKLDQFLLDRTS